METIYYNGIIRTMDEAGTCAEAIGVENGRIIFVGTNEEALARVHGPGNVPAEATERDAGGTVTTSEAELPTTSADTTQTVDLAGRAVYPGFIDSHLHYLNYAFVRQSYRMNGAASIAEIIEEGRRRVAAFGPEDGDRWLYGRGWNQDNFTDEQRFLTRQDLDQITTDYPILMIRSCGHIAAVNSPGLERVLQVPDIGDYIHLIDQENGYLTEAAVKSCYNAMTKPTVAQIKEFILSVQDDFLEKGITCVGTDNFLSLPGRDGDSIMQAHRELEEEGLLKLRIQEQASFTSFEDMKAFIDAGHGTGEGGDRYTIGPIKLFQDGSLGAKTALMNAPYLGDEAQAAATNEDEADAAEDDVVTIGSDAATNGGSTAHEGATNYGTMIHDAEDLQRLVDYAYDHDNQILIHTIGDRASDMVCDAYANAIDRYGQKHLRLAINHLQLVSNDLFDRMAAYEMVPFIQPCFVASDKAMVARLVGEERAATSYAWKTMADKGLTLCGSSDASVESFDILENVEVAVTRRKIGETGSSWHADQCLSPEEAMAAFTRGNAYGMFLENEIGSLEVGKAADLVVLDEDVMTVAPERIHEIPVAATIIAGDVVWESEQGNGIFVQEPAAQETAQEPVGQDQAAAPSHAAR